MNDYQLMPPYSKKKYKALYEDIKKHGQRHPILVDEEGNILDGHTRAKICKELGIGCEKEIVKGLSKKEKFEFSLRENINRRHLSSKDKHEIAVKIRGSEFGIDYSQKEIAEFLGVHESTVSRWFGDDKKPEKTNKMTVKDYKNEVSRLKTLNSNQQKHINEIETRYQKAKELMMVFMSNIKKDMTLSPELESVVAEIEIHFDVLPSESVSEAGADSAEDSSEPGIAEELTVDGVQPDSASESEPESEPEPESESESEPESEPETEGKAEHDESAGETAA
jgi:predicted transcriptional regulator